MTKLQVLIGSALLGGLVGAGFYLLVPDQSHAHFFGTMSIGELAGGFGVLGAGLGLLMGRRLP